MPTEPRIAFFDMDHTLMDNDCDVSWKAFLIEEGLADPSENAEAARFYQDYRDGKFNIEAFLEFQLRQFRDRTPDEMAALARRHFERHARSRLYPDAVAAVADLRGRALPVFLLTATNDVIARPVAEALGFDGLLATRLETRDGRYTGRIVLPYCFGEDKTGYARALCAERGMTLRDAAYYGDSRADIPVLEAVGFPVVVNPAEPLRALAAERRWPVETWRLPA